jgi:hypothetical protein
MFHPRDELWVTYNKSRQPRSCSRPETAQALFVEDPVCTVERVAVLRPGPQRLHAGLDYAVQKQRSHVSEISLTPACLMRPRRANTHSRGMVV